MIASMVVIVAGIIVTLAEDLGSVNNVSIINYLLWFGAFSVSPYP